MIATVRDQCWNIRTFYGGARNRVGIGLSYWPASGIDSSESLPGLLKSLNIRVLYVILPIPICSHYRLPLMGQPQEMVRQKSDWTDCVKKIRHPRKYYLYHLARSISTTKGWEAIREAIWRKYTSHTSIRGFLRKLVSSSRESICIILFLRTETDPYLHTLHLSKPALFHPKDQKVF